MFSGEHVALSMQTNEENAIYSNNSPISVDLIPLFGQNIHEVKSNLHKDDFIRVLCTICDRLVQIDFIDDHIMYVCSEICQRLTCPCFVEFFVSLEDYVLHMKKVHGKSLSIEELKNQFI